MTNKEPKQYLFSILAICILITFSLQIYLPTLKITEGVAGMFVFNLVGLLIIHHFCNRSSIRDFSIKETTTDVKIIFYCELIILAQLLFFVLLYTFFGVQRESIYDLVILLLFTTYLFIRGDEYLNFGN